MLRVGVSAFAAVSVTPSMYLASRLPTSFAWMSLVNSQARADDVVAAEIVHLAVLVDGVVDVVVDVVVDDDDDDDDVVVVVDGVVDEDGFSKMILILGSKVTNQLPPHPQHQALLPLYQSAGCDLCTFRLKIAWRTQVHVPSILPHQYHHHLLLLLPPPTLLPSPSPSPSLSLHPALQQHLRDLPTPQSCP